MIIKIIVGILFNVIGGIMTRDGIPILCHPVHVGGYLLVYDKYPSAGVQIEGNLRQVPPLVMGTWP
jgi:hypothetical protein